MSAHDLVFADGDRVLAMGRLVREGRDWWLDSQRVMTLASRMSGERSRNSTRLVGADAHVAALRKQDPQAARLWMHVIGRWQRDAITVEAVGAGPGRPDEPEFADTSTDQVGALDSIRATLEARAADWRLEARTDSSDEDGHRYVAVQLPLVTREIADWADRLPTGSVWLDPSIRRIGSTT